MSYGRKYTTSYKRRSGGTTVIDILEKNYSAGVTTLIADADCLQIELDGDVNNIYQSTRGSGASIKLMVTPLTFTTFFTVDPQKYVVKVYSDYSGGNLIWQGFINTGLYQENYSTSSLTPIVITCGDGMAVLDDIPYMVSATGATYGGFTNVATVMQNIFSKLGIAFSTIRTANDLKIADYSTNPFLYLTVNNENYLDEDGVAMSCRQVLDSVFGALGLSMTFRGEIIYLVDPINLHVPAKGSTYGTSPVYGYNETQQNLGGYVDVSGTTLNWYQTGQILDVVQPFNQVEIRYDPYNFTEGRYDFNAEGNAGNTSTYGSYANDGTNYNVYTNVTMKDWTINGIYGFEGLQKFTTGSTTTTGTTDFYIKQVPSTSGSYEYTIPYSNIKQDENMKLELSADFYVNTKHISNIWSTAAGTLVKEIRIPVYLKVGNLWYGGGNLWQTGMTSTTLILRTPDTRNIQTYVREGWWLWRHTELVNTDASQINDTWTTGKAIIDMGQSAAEDLINGSIHLYIPKGLTLSDVTPSTAEAQIKNVMIKNIRVVPVKTDLTTVGNDGVNVTATLYSYNTIKKSPLSINLTTGCGTYGSSKGAFSTDQQVVQGQNISGLARSGSSTYYNTTKLLAQSLISQYNVPRIKLTANLDVRNYLLSIEQKLIKDNHYLAGKAFYIANGTYYDGEENMTVEMVELTATRENIL